MKFVALISGGKDSFYNIMQCMNNGHTLGALANLHPSDVSVNELDSFMYQTVGHDTIEYYRQCIDERIPLYRRAILGSSSNVSLEYVKTSDDETEDLYELLKQVKELHPDIEGVSCGAILSHYQRTRVENVCGRLNLTCLAYLWQSDQAQLLSEMCQSGLEAILIKVAAVGLTENHLGKSLSEMFPVLTKLNSMYDVHVCGEGGEFESLVLDAPFFIRKLRVTESKVTLHSSDASYLSLSVEVVEKDECKQKLDLPRPSLLLKEYEALANKLDSSHNTALLKADQQVYNCTIMPYAARSEMGLLYGNVTSDLQTVEAQTRDILFRIKDLLDAQDLSISQIQHMTVLVLDMNDFARINTVYESFFDGIFLPPSRVCIETTLPATHKLQMSCLVSTKKTKSGIHIRSRSYWAPQNIGPYSQAIVQNCDNLKLATLSGQIPLIPSSMTMDPSMSSVTSSTLSLQHLHRVKTLINVKEIASVTCFITESTSPKTIADLWKQYVLKFEHESGTSRRLTILQVTGLPRQATVEWGGLAYEKIPDMYADDSDEELPALTNAQSEVVSRFKYDVLPLGSETRIKFTCDDIEDLMSFLREPLVIESPVSIMSSQKNIHRLTSSGLNAEWTPVVAVFDENGEEVEFGVSWIIAA